MDQYLRFKKLQSGEGQEKTKSESVHSFQKNNRPTNRLNPIAGSVPTCGDGPNRHRPIDSRLGESMEDMGLESHIEERECEDCFNLIDEDSTISICNKCWIKIIDS